MYFSPTNAPLFKNASKKIQFLLTKTISVFIVPVEFPSSLVNKTVLFWSTAFHLLTNRFLTTQNHWKPFKTIKRKKADFSVFSKPFKIVENHWKSARVERVARIELALSGRKHDILPLNYTRILFVTLQITSCLLLYYTRILFAFQVYTILVKHINIT